MWCKVLQVRKLGLICFEACFYDGQGLHIHSCVSEAAARSWLATKGVPFSEQPRQVAALRKASK